MQQENKQPETKEARFNWRFWLNYRWVVKNIPFFLYCALLCVVYIANGHLGDRMIRRINKLGREVKELGYENKTLSGSLMFKSKQSELEKAVAPLGLYIPDAPPIVIQNSITPEKK
jgi:hypothetical protein